MFELERTDEVCRLTAITKSNSGVSGPELAKAHMRLGELLAEKIDMPPEELTIVAMLRGGIFLAEGMYFRLGCKFQTYDPKYERFVRPKTKYIIVADSVINTGKTISAILEPDMLVACCVASERAVALFDRQLLTARVSANSFVGSNIIVQRGARGPDTTLRLFNQL